MYSFSFRQPLLVLLVELTLLYILIQLNVICLSKYGQYLIIYLSYSFIGVFNELQYLHQNSSLVQYPLQSHRMKNEAIDGVQGLADELRIILLA